MKILKLSNDFNELLKLNNDNYKETVYKILDYKEIKDSLTEREKFLIKNILKDVLNFLENEIIKINEIQVNLNFKNKKFKKKSKNL